MDPTVRAWANDVHLCLIRRTVTKFDVMLFCAGRTVCQQRCDTEEVARTLADDWKMAFASEPSQVLAPMPWKCPACSAQIQHARSEDTPRRGAIYRCHICRLELVVDPSTRKLKVALFV